MRRHRPPRIAGFSYTGVHRYSLTLCTFSRQPLFQRELIVEMALGEFLRTAGDEDFEILAYCFMPDHVHLLVTGTTDVADARRFMKTSKQRSAYVLRTRQGVPRLWQEGFYDHVLRNEESTFDVVRYIFGNPVRAGLVRSPDEYRFMGSSLGSVSELLG